MESEFEEWVRARGPVVLRAAYLLTGQQQAAEDLAQDALERVSRVWHRVESPDAYCRRVMHHLHVRGWRRGRRVVFQGLESVDGPAVDAHGHVETRMVLRAALAGLSRGQRSVVVLRFYEDLSERETAAVLGCSVGTVKSQTHKALSALRESSPHLAELLGERSIADV